MKYIKHYEILDTKPHVGQYAAGYSETATEPEKSILPTLIGEITEIDSRGFYVITYPLGALQQYNNNKWYFRKDQLICFGDSEEEVELKLNANKYNL